MATYRYEVKDGTGKVTIGTTTAANLSDAGQQLRDKGMFVVSLAPVDEKAQKKGFNLDLSFRILFMVVIGGLGTVLGSFLGAAFVTLMPVFLSVTVRFLDSVLGLRIAESTISNLELMVFGALIIFFLIVEPHGLARLWQIGKEKLRLWPFPH